ncbi:hypothetical protein [Nonomuraea endophytica]|uniref:hypothetical protein n=1 Tax=Nonomuraea endophytica TaxID=714136 RepID=UPI0037C5BF5C
MEPISSLSREWISYFIRGASGTETVEIALTAPGVEPTEADWNTAEWNPTSATAHGAVARFLFGPGGTVARSEGTYQTWVRIAAPPQLPVLPAGLIDVI